MTWRRHKFARPLGVRQPDRFAGKCIRPTFAGAMSREFSWSTDVGMDLCPEAVFQMAQDGIYTASWAGLICILEMDWF